jgi:ATP-dependent helicase/nuclease subunit B
MNGLMLNDQSVIKLMDQTLESGESQIVSAGIKQDGNLTKRSKVASAENFSDLRNYVRNQYQKSGNDIIDGHVEIAPYKWKDKTACTFCPFKSVCQLDELIESEPYRVLEPLSNEQVLELIREERTCDE